MCDAVVSCSYANGIWLLLLLLLLMRKLNQVILLLLPSESAVGHTRTCMLCQQPYRLTSIEFVYDAQFRMHISTTHLVSSTPSEFSSKASKVSSGILSSLIFPCANFELWQFCCRTLTRWQIWICYKTVCTQLIFCYVHGHKVIKNIVWLKYTYVKWYNWNFRCMLSRRLTCYVDFNKHPRMVYAHSCVLVDMKVNINIYQSSFFLPSMLTHKQYSKCESQGICVHPSIYLAV